jgi:UDP-N-acetylmuramoyl-tripeptide--D-alanyl-D-alanine ligase
MQPLSVKEIETAVSGIWWNQQDGMKSVTSVSTDSRKIEKNSLFIPLSGENFDGHNYIDTALDKGAAGVLCARLPENLRADKFYIKVDDTRLALKALAKYLPGSVQISPLSRSRAAVGKTTSKDMIASVLSARYRVLKTPENYNNDMGVPLTLLGAEAGIRRWPSSRRG